MVVIPKAAPLRTAQWLFTHRYGPNVYIFRHLDSGQVVYSQTPFPPEVNIEQQFQFANWQNKKPSTRRDMWRAMAIAELPTYQQAVEFYNNLLKLRWMRDRSMKNQARAWRKPSPEGNIWHYAQYRPTYSQESVADLVSAIESVGGECKLHWEDSWRKGDSSYWSSLKVEHLEMPKCNPRDRFVVLRKIADAGFKSYVETNPEGVRLVSEGLPELKEPESKKKKGDGDFRKRRFQKIADSPFVKAKKRALEQARTNLAKSKSKLAKIAAEGATKAVKQQAREENRACKQAIARASKALTVAKQQNSLAVRGIKLKVKRSSRVPVSRH